MKLGSALLRTFTTLHTWVGIVAGFALFVAFYAGAITIFHHDLPLWQSPDAIERPVEILADAQRLLDGTLARYPAARTHVGMLFPGDESPETMIYWQEADGTWLFASNAEPVGAPTASGMELSELVNALHYALGVPGVGTTLMGIVSLLYGVALVSGVVLFLPKLAKDLFALRPGRNLKQFWQDAHNIVGILSLPMHIMFAVTGALLCLFALLISALNPLVFENRAFEAMSGAFDTAPIRAAANTPAPAPGTLALWHARAVEEATRDGVVAFEPHYLKLANAGDAHAIVEVTGATPRALGALGSVAFDANTGERLAAQLPGARDANHVTMAAAYALHFGEFGSGLVPWLYFFMGLGGAFLFYSGNLLWIEARRRRRQQVQGRAQRVMARATVGACIGVCVAISAAFVAAQVAEAYWATQVDAVVRWTCFVTWGLCGLWACVRSPAQAARELLWAAAGVTVLVAVAHGVMTGWWPWRSAVAGYWPLFWIDVIAVGMAVGFAAMARATRGRARSGDANSVWADVR